MRIRTVLWALAALSCASPRPSPPAKPTLVPDLSFFESGKRARFHAASRGWLDGFVVHRLPSVGVRCLAVYVPELSGAVMLAEMDSLRVDRNPGVGNRGPLPPP